MRSKNICIAKVSVGLLVLVTLGGAYAPPVWAQSGDSLLDQLRPFTPQSILADAKKFPDRFGNPRRIGIVFERADFKGTGQFDFFVVSYDVGVSWAVRLLRLAGNQFTVVNDPLVDMRGGAETEMELVDVDNDGVPEVAVRRFGVRTDYNLLVLKWDSTGLQVVAPADGFGDADLRDVDGDGKLEVVVPPDCIVSSNPQPCTDQDVFEVYKLNGAQFTLAFTSRTDPSNPTAGTSQFAEVFAYMTNLTPDEFPLDEIHHAVSGQGRDEGVVTVRLGNLRAMTPGNLFSPVDASDVDTSSLILGRDIKALRTQFRNPDATEITKPPSGSNPTEVVPPQGRFIGVSIEVEFSRQAVLAFIPKAQPDKPLAPGDVITLDITGRMRNGAPLHASVGAQIVGAGAPTQ